MAFKEQSCTIKRDGKELILNFRSAVVDKKEVYLPSLSDKNGYYLGSLVYMTKDMVNKLLSLDERGKRYIDRVNFSYKEKLASEYQSYGQKIVLDLPDEISDKAFLMDFSLFPCTYARKPGKPLFLKVHSEFTYLSERSDLFLIPENEDNHYSIDMLNITRRHPFKTEIHLDICENKLSSLWICDYADETNDKVAFGLRTGRPNEEVIAKNITFSTNKSNGGNIWFSSGKELIIEGCEIETDGRTLNSLDDVVLESKGALHLNSSTLKIINLKTQGDRKCGIISGDDVFIQNSKCSIYGLSTFDRGLDVNYTSNASKIFLQLEEVKATSPVAFESKKFGSSDFKLRYSKLNNGEKKISFKEGTKLNDVEINNGGNEELTLSDFSCSFSTLNNISDIYNASISNLEANNLVIENDKKIKDDEVRIGFWQSNFHYDSNKEVSTQRANKLNNCIVDVEDGSFYLDNNMSLEAENSIFKNSQFYGAVEENQKLIINNSSLSNAAVKINFDSYAKGNLEINCSQIDGKLEAKNLSLVENSTLSGVNHLEGVTEVRDSFLEDYSSANSRQTKIIDFHQGEETSKVVNKELETL